MSRKIYIPGSELTPNELNTYQDEYIKAGYEVWKTIGACDINEFSSNTARSTYGSPTPWRLGNSQSTALQRAVRLNPADWANSYNGSLRTRQLRLVATFKTDLIAILDRVNTIALRSVTSTATVNSWSFGSLLGTITVPSLTIPSTTTRIEGNAFTFPASGMYAIEIASRAQTAVANVGVQITVLLQTRAI